MSNDRHKKGSQTTIIAGINDPERRAADGTTIAVGATAKTSVAPAPNAMNSSVDSVQSERLGRYVKLGLLGVGGMGEVFRVYDGMLKRSIALKTLHLRLVGNQRIVSRFLEEAQIVAQLQHPNIIPVHELGQLPDGRHYFTMQEIRGTEFTTQIQAVHRASEPGRWHPGEDGTTFRDLIQTFHQVCVTMAYAHSRGVLHRDLKPDNIMIGGFGDVLVVDWGLAKLIGSIEDPEVGVIESDRSQDDGLATRMGTIAGTPTYMSPEQAGGQTELIGTASDIYTLGAILYELLGGIPPFAGSSGNEIVKKVQTSQPPSLLPHPAAEDDSMESSQMDAIDRRTKLPSALVRICERAMEREISDRYATAEELAGEVRAWLDGVEKRDKALKEVESAALILQQAVAQDLMALKRWGEANAMTEREGAPSDASWELWHKAKLAEMESERLRRLHLRKLEGALVHDPGLKEAHLELALLQIGKLADAVAVGDIRTKEVYRVGFDNHIKFLSSPLANQLRSQCENRLTDNIAGRRARRGSMVGRDQLRREVSTQIRGGRRLISLVGTAGVGKTRLALELAQDLRDDVDRAVFCDLTEATDSLGVVRLISAAMGARVGEDDPIGQLAELLAVQSTLLILDNLEQVIDPVGSICQVWIQRLPTLKILATSRARLGIPAETIVSLKPLSLLESVELFARRGQLADSRFELNPSNRELVCGLVQKLDGLPLAIELAAARLNTLSLDEILERLAGRFQLLRSRGKDAQALDGALDWSWDLLEPFEQAALAQVSIFRGGFNLAAAESVVDVSAWKNAPAMFEIVAALSDNSLLLKIPTHDGSVRYGLLESIRAYAKRKLSTPGALQCASSGPEAMGAAQKRHAIHFSRMGEPDYLRQLTGFGSTARWKELFPELDNLVVAIDCGVGSPSGKCCLAALKILGMKGPVSLGIDLATRVLRGSKLPRRLKIQIELERSKCLRISGRMDEARAVVSESTSLLDEPEKHDDSPSAFTELNQPTSVEKEMELDGEPANIEKANSLEADRLIELGSIEQEQGNYDKAEGFYNRSLAIAKKCGDRARECQVVGKLGAIAWARNQYQVATERYTQAIKIAKECKDKRLEAHNLCNLGSVYCAQGFHGQATDLYTIAIDIFREIGNQRMEGTVLGNLGCLVHVQGHHEQAVEHLNEATQIFHEFGDKRSEGSMLGNLGLALHALDRTDEAGVAFRSAISLCDQGYTMAAGSFRGALALLVAEQGELDEAFELLKTGEAQVEVESLAKFLCLKGRVQVIAGQVAAARMSLQQAQEIATDLNMGVESDLATTIARLRGVLENKASNEDESSDSETETLFDARPEGVESAQTDRPMKPKATPGPSADQAPYFTQNMEAVRLMELGNIEYRQAHFDAALRCYRIALEQFRSLGDRDGEATALGRLGVVYGDQGDIDEAIKNHIQSIDISRETGQRILEGVSLSNLGANYRSLGQIDRAIDCHNQAIQIFRAMGDKRSEGLCLGSLGAASTSQGQLEQAIEYYDAALEIAQSMNDTIHESVVLGNRGYIFMELDRLDEAGPSLQRAISLADNVIPAAAGAFRGGMAIVHARSGRFDEAFSLIQAGEPQVEPEPYEHIKFLIKKGEVQLLAGMYKAAEDSLSQAQTLAANLQIPDESEVITLIEKLSGLLDESALVERKLGERSTATEPGSDMDGGNARATIEADSLIEMGNIEREQSNYELANKSYSTALSLYQEHGHTSGEGVAHERLGSVCRIQGKHDEANQHFQLSLQVSRSIGDRQQEGVSLGGLATSLLDQGKFQAAIEHYERALTIHRDLGDKRGEGNTFGTLGIACAAQGHLKLALEHFEKALSIQQAIGDKPALGRVHGNMANALRGNGQLHLAIEHYEFALDIWRAIGDCGNEGMTRGNLGVVLHRMGQPDEARAMLEEAIQICGDSVPLAVGACCGSLAQILAEQGDLAQAHRLLERGEPALEGYRVEFGKFLCRKGVVQYLDGQKEAAQASLFQANDIAQELQVNERSELARAITTLHAMM